MANKLEDRPGSQYDDTWKPSPEGESPDDLEDLYNTPNASDEDLPETHPGRSKKSLDNDELADAEASGATPTANDATQAEEDKLPQQATEGRWYKDGLKKQVRGKFWTRKKAIGGGVAGLVIGGGIGLFSILQGPLQIIHFAQLLQRFHFSNNEEFANGRTARFMYFLRNGSVGTGLARTRLGSIGNSFANKIELRLQNEAGLRSLYDTRTGRLMGYELVDRDKAVTFLGDNLEASADFDLKAPGTINDPNIKSIDGKEPLGGVLRMRDEKFKTRRSFTRTITKAVHTNRTAGSISSRLLIRRGGIDFHPIKNIKRSAGDSLLKYYDARKRERAAKINEGVDLPDGELADEARKVADLPEERSELLKKLARGGGIAASVFGALCTVHQLGKDAEAFEYANKMLPMMRIGGQIVTTGNQVMSGQDLNMDELGSIAADLYDEETEQSWAAARSIQAELGQPQTGPDIPAEARLGEDVKGSGIFGVVNSIPLVGSLCGIAGDIVGKIPGMQQINGAIARLFPVIDEFYDQLLSFLAHGSVNALPVGPELGNLANHGARLAANDQAIALGGRALSSREEQNLSTDSSLAQQEDFSKQSFIARTFNIYDNRSVLGGAAFRAPHTPSQAIASLLKTPFNFSSLFAKPALAENNYDYGFPQFGFSLSEQDDERFEDPLANAEIVEPLLDDQNVKDENGEIKEVIQGLNSKYGKKCFNMRVNHEDSGVIESFEAKPYNEIPKECNDTGNEELMRYRFYIADFVTAHSLACYEGDDFSCQQVGL